MTWKLHGGDPGQIIPPHLTQGQRFAIADRHLDQARSGSMWLKDPRVAAAVRDTFFRGQDEWHLYELFAWVILSNHVHLLLKPHCALAEVTRAVKSCSAQQANSILKRSGKPFWQDESYDHWVRDGREFDRIKHYIEWNPANAGLVEKAADWEWSSALLGRPETCPT